MYFFLTVAALLTGIQIKGGRFSRLGNAEDSRFCGIPSFDSADVVEGETSTESRSGQTIKLKCKRRFYEAEATSECLNGVWSYPNPPCEYVQCPHLGTLVNGGYEMQEGLGVDAKITFKCNKGFWLQGSKTRVCERSGQWSGTKTSCTEVRCPPLTPPSQGTLTALPPYSYNDEVGLVCKNKEIYDGKIIKCLSNATWTEGGIIGRCIDIIEIQCSSPKKGNMIVTPDKEVYSYNKTIKISCEEGFIYNGSKTRKCLLRKWSGAHGTCNRIYCGKPAFNIQKGKFETCNLCPYGTKLNVTCEEGYILQNNSSLVCKFNGTHGKWVNIDEICKAVMCGSVPTVENGLIEGNNSGVFKDERTVQCNEGFHYQGPGNIKCQHDGKWSYPGICHTLESKVPHIVTIGVVLPIVLFVLIGLILPLIHFRCFKNGTMRLKESIRKGGHYVENALDATINLDTQFIQLRLVDDDKKFQKEAARAEKMDKFLSLLERFEKLQEVVMDDLIDGLEGGGVIVIQGRAGVGKTTLVQKLSRKWATKKWAQNYEALFIFNMRYISSRDKRIMTLGKFLKEYMQYRTGHLRSLISKGIKAEGKGWIIFMDAVDEFPNLLQRLENFKAEDTIYSGDNRTELPAYKWCIHLWRTQVLPKAVVILTSRHIKDLKKLNPKRNIEILGLTPDNIMKMIDSQMEDKTEADGLKNVLKNNEVLMSASSITFLCLMLCKTFTQSQNFAEESVDLKTYTSIIIFLIQSFIRRNKKDDSEDTPLNQTEILKLQPFTKLAYMGLCEHKNDIELAQLIFDEEDIKKAGVRDTDLRFAQKLGLIVCSEQAPFNQGKGQRIIEFLHLSIQELLAMTYLLNQEPNTAVDMFNSMWDKKQFSMAQLFLFGLCFDEGIRAKELFMLEPNQCVTEELKHCLSQALAENATKDIKDRHQVLRAIQAAYETRNTECSNKVAMALFKDKIIALRDIQLTAVDLLGINAMIDSHREITELRFERVSTDESTLSVLSTFLSRNNTIETLALIGIRLKEESFNALMNAVLENSRLKHLFLEDADIDDKMTFKLKDMLQTNKFLEEISIAHNEITEVGIWTIAEGLSINDSLEKLILDSERIDLKYIGALTYLTNCNKKVKISVRGACLEPKIANYANGITSLRERIVYETTDTDMKKINIITGMETDKI